MRLQTFPTPDLFLRSVQPMLEAHETRNNLILGVALRLAQHPEWTETEPYLASAADDSDHPVLAAAITPPRNLLLACDPSAPEAQRGAAIHLLAENLIQSGQLVPGVNAENELASEFAETWTKYTGTTYRVQMRQRVYELRQVIHLTTPPPGRLRLAGMEDQDLVARWHYAFCVEAIGHGTLDESQKLAARRVPMGDIFVWEDQVPVSMAMRARPTPHGRSVTAVYTPPERRGRGYASACVAGLSQELLDSGRLFCNLFTDLDYAASNSIYQKIGYQPVCDFYMIRFQE